MDDSQLYFSFKADSSNSQREAFRVIEECIADVRIWMISHRLLTDDTKTEVFIIGSYKELSKVSIESIAVGTSVIKPVECVRNLGAWFDNRMSMDSHVVKVCITGFRGLHSIRQIRKFFSEESTKTLVHAFVTSHLDYCSCLQHGIPKYQCDCLQKILNAAARVIPTFDHITPILIKLHWLPVYSKIQLKILLLAVKALEAKAPVCIRDLLKPKAAGGYTLRSDL